MRELIERNELEPGRRRQLHLHAHRRPRRRVPGRRRARAWASSRVPLLCAREIAVPGALPRVIRVLLHYYADGGPRAPGTSTSARRGRCAPTSKRHNRLRPWRIEFAEHGPAHPGLPGRAATRCPRTSRCSPPTSRPYPPLPAVVEAVTQRAARPQPLSGPDERRAARARCRDRYGVPAERIAIGNGSCDILLAAGEALLEPGAELVYAWPSFSVYPHLAAASGARAIARAARRRATARPRRDAARDHRRDAAGDRLQPEQPDEHGAAARRDRRVRRERPAPRLRDPRRGLLRVQHARRPRRVARPARASTRTSSCCARSRRSTGSAGLRVGFALCGSEEFRQRGRPGAPAVLLQRRRAGRRDRGARHQDEVAEPRRARVAARIGHRRAGCASWASSPPSSQANFCWFDARRRRATRRAIDARRWPSAGVLVRAGTALGREGALRVTYGTPAENARFLDALASACVLSAC